MGPRVVILEHLGHIFHVQDICFSGGASFPGVLGPSWDPRVVRDWIWRDSGVPLDLTLEVNFQVVRQTADLGRLCF